MQYTVHYTERRAPLTAVYTRGIGLAGSCRSTTGNELADPLAPLAGTTPAVPLLAEAFGGTNSTACAAEEVSNQPNQQTTAQTLLLQVLPANCSRPLLLETVDRRIHTTDCTGTGTSVCRWGHQNAPHSVKRVLKHAPLSVQLMLRCFRQLTGLGKLHVLHSLEHFLHCPFHLRASIFENGLRGPAVDSEALQYPVERTLFVPQ
jgi:hypothetical protein